MEHPQGIHTELIELIYKNHRVHYDQSDPLMVFATMYEFYSKKGAENLIALNNALTDNIKSLIEHADTRFLNEEIRYIRSLSEIIDEKHMDLSSSIKDNHALTAKNFFDEWQKQLESEHQKQVKQLHEANKTAISKYTRMMLYSILLNGLFSLCLVGIFLMR